MAQAASGDEGTEGVAGDVRLKDEAVVQEVVAQATTRVVREALGLTQTEFGRRLGVTRWTVARWEDGTSVPHEVYEARMKQMIATMEEDATNGT